MTTSLGIDRYLLDDAPARWAVACIRQLCGTDAPPEYGSPWWNLVGADVQVAAAIRAAEAYRQHVLFLPQTLADELAAARRLQEEYDAHAYAELAARVEHNRHYDRSWWARQANQPSHAQLVERRSS